MNKQNYEMRKRFSRYLGESGAKLSDLARKAEVSQTVLSAMKMGHIPNTKQLIGVCSVTGLSADYLLGLRSDNAPVRRNIEFHKLYKTVSENLKQLVAENSGRATFESERCGLSCGSISNYIERKYFPTTASALKIAACYNVSLDWLLGLSEEEKI